MENVTKKLFLGFIISCFAIFGFVIGFVICSNGFCNANGYLYKDNFSSSVYSIKSVRGFGTHTVSFDANGGSGTMASISEVGGSYVLPTCTFDSPITKTFVGWKAGSDGKILYYVGDEYPVEKDVTFYAVWEDYDFVTQPVGGTLMVGSGKVVSWKVNFGSVGYEICRMNGGTAQVIDEVETNISPNVVRGYNFVQDKDVAGTYTYRINVLYGSGQVVSNTFDITWTETYVETFTVSFNANGGSGTMLDVDDQVGVYYLPSCSFRAPKGKEFVGWSTTPLGSAIEGATYDVGDDLTLYAVWENIKLEPEITEEKTNAASGLSGGAIVGIVLAIVIVGGVGGFAIYWFVVKKKTFADLTLKSNKEEKIERQPSDKKEIRPTFEKEEEVKTKPLTQKENKKKVVKKATSSNKVSKKTEVISTKATKKVETKEDSIKKPVNATTKTAVKKTSGSASKGKKVVVLRRKK